MSLDDLDDIEDLDDLSSPKKRGRPKGSGLIGINRLLTRKQELFVKELVSKDGQITKRQAAISVPKLDPDFLTKA